MKRTGILAILFVFVFACGFSQDINQNYIRTRVMLHESDPSKCLETIQYYDGLGRPFLNVQKNVTPSGTNLATLQEYDGVGRESISWLPYVTSSDYLSPQNIKGNIYPSYSDSRPYSESVYEASPLNRIVKQYGPGTAWATHPVSTDYLINTATGTLCCKLYKVDTSGSLVQNGNYAAGSLYVNQAADEDGRLSYSFTDMLGQVVLTRQLVSDEPYDTYYVYDDFGNMRFVLPPAYQDTPDLSLYGYQYKYDARNRCVEKTLPGCEPIWYVYDKADHPALSQSGVQRVKHEWSFTLYDALNRVVVTGTIQTQRSREQLANDYRDVLFRGTLSKSSLSDLSKADNLLGYEAPVLSGYKVKVLLANYYDRYDFLSLDCFNTYVMDYVEDASFGIRHESAQGLLTGTYVRQLDDLKKGEFIAHYYDVRGREIQTVSKLAPYEHSNLCQTKYNFTGQPLLRKYLHSSSYYIYPYLPGDPRAENHQQELYEYDYDNASRLIKTYHTHNGGQRVLLSELIYDNYGRLQEKRRHDGQDTIRYTYNIRNWTLSIKSRGFEEELFYNTGSFTDADPCYNGNISAIKYNQNGNKYTYHFLYDGLSRLSAANAYDSQAIRVPHHEFYMYDKMGNITYLERRLNSSKIDALEIRYTGNQIKNVSLRNPISGYSYDFGSMSYPDLSDAAIEYYYDTNGNLIKNLDKGVVSTRYNFLNLPDTVQFQNGNQIINSYLADGRKVKTVYKTYSTGIVVPQDSVYHGNASYSKSTDEWNGHYMYRTWQNSTPEMFMVQTPEGYIGADHVGIDSHRNYAYYYYVHDHLGNVRITRNSQGYYQDQSLEYYPSGVLFDRSSEQSRQPYMFGGKELVSMHGLNEYDFTGRWQDPLIPRFTSIDPLCEKYYSISPYVYCLNNPIKYVDPDGTSTWVIQDNNGNYRVVGGNLDDDDRNIYLWGRQPDGGVGIDGTIGVSSTMTSFYNSDEEKWMGTIDTNDHSGMDFLSDLVESDPELTDYMENAVGGEKYDFKRQGVDKDDKKHESSIYYYRGTSLGKDSKGNTIYASARDVGNIGAGFIAGRNNMSWKASRAAFDALQTKQDGHLSTEGISTKNAEYCGWVYGRIDAINHPIKTMKRNSSSILPGLRYVIKKLK